MEYLKALKNSISSQFKQNAENKKRESFSKLMRNFGQMLWHSEAMHRAVIGEHFDMACAHAEEVINYWNCFSLIFSDLSFESSDKNYVPELQRIINFRGDYGRKAAEIIQDMHEKVRLEIESHIPSYVFVTFEINYPTIDDIPQCDDETWYALGMFFCYENLILMRPPRHIGEKYVYFMKRIAQNYLGVNTITALPALHHAVSITMDDSTTDSTVLDPRFRINERLQSVQTTVGTLEYSSSIEYWFVLTSGFTCEGL